MPTQSLATRRGQQRGWVGATHAATQSCRAKDLLESLRVAIRTTIHEPDAGEVATINLLTETYKRAAALDPSNRKLKGVSMLAGMVLVDLEVKDKSVGEKRSRRVTLQASRVERALYLAIR